MNQTPNHGTVVPAHGGGTGAPQHSARQPSGRHRSPRRRGRGGRAALVVVPLAVLGSGALVFQASNAAFTATTQSGANTFAAGTVVLTNSTSGSALFSVTGIKPGAALAASQYQCVTVDYKGSLASSVKLYLANFSNPAAGAHSHNLGSYLRVKIEQSSTTTSDAACTGFTATGTYVNAGGSGGDDSASLSTAATNWSNGLGAWAAPQETSPPSTGRTRSATGCPTCPRPACRTRRRWTTCRALPPRRISSGRRATPDRDPTVRGPARAPGPALVVFAGAARWDIRSGTARR